MAVPLAPLPYHCLLRDYLKQHEANLWQWFCSTEAQSDYTAQVRLDSLLKTNTHTALSYVTEACRNLCVS